MIKILTGSQMKYIDQKTIKELNIPGIILMENAGRCVANKVLEILKINKNNIESKNVFIICGKGNNGGDGFVAARHLLESGIQTSVLSIYEEKDLSGAALINHNILKNLTEIVYFSEINAEKFRDMVSISIVIVDAIFGTGLSSEVKGDLYNIIEDINKYSEGKIVSVDIPSGVDSNTGIILGNAVFADYTVTFLAPKLGSVVYPGAEYSGEVVTCNISIPEFLLKDQEYNISLITKDYAVNHLPCRPENSHKGMFGKVFNIAGSLGMTGAAYMSAISSLRAGAGYSILAAPKSIIPILSTMAPELIFVEMEESVDKCISMGALNLGLEKSKDSDCILIGPGIGTSLTTVEFVVSFIQSLADRNKKVIIDADALNCLAIKKDFVLPLNSVITPHPKELSRLMDVPISEILNDHVKYVKQAAEKFNTTVVLKGANTLIAQPDGTLYINSTGNNALATAGTGDVLAGMITGLAAQGLELKDAAALGVYLHGLAGDIAAQELTEYSLIASDLLKYIPKAIKTLKC